jgi:hypothetical protein
VEEKRMSEKRIRFSKDREREIFGWHLGALRTEGELSA